MKIAKRGRTFNTKSSNAVIDKKKSATYPTGFRCQGKSANYFQEQGILEELLFCSEKSYVSFFKSVKRQIIF